MGRLHVVSHGGAHKRHLFNRAEVALLAAELNSRSDDVVLLQDYLTQAADLEDRRHALAVELVADDAWMPAWRRFVAALHRRTAGLVARAAAVVGALAPGDPSTSRIDPAAPPRPDVPEIALIRPWLTTCADWLATAPSFRAVAVALEPPAPGPPPPRPASVADARSAWRAARSAWRSARVAARRGHRKRDAVRAAITEALGAWRSTWWGWRNELPELAGDPARIQREGLALAERARLALLAVAS